VPVMSSRSSLRNRSGHSESGHSESEPANFEYDNTQDDEHVDVIYQNPVRPLFPFCVLMLIGYVD